MGILVNESQIGGGGSSNTSHNIGDIFYTTRTDNSLNGAVECNGSQYNIDDYSGIGSIGELLQSKKLPYISINEFDSRISESGSCGYFGYGIDTHWGKWDAMPGYVYTNKTPVEVGDPVYDAPGGNIIGEITRIDSTDRTCIYYDKTDGTSGFGYSDNWVYGPVESTPYFKVPKLNKVYIKADSSNIGQYLEAGLPNILGTYTNSAWGKGDESPIVSGALYRAGIGNRFGASGNTAIRNGIMSFDASRSNPIYGNSDTVTPETICLRPMIQLFTGVLETSVATCNQVLADVSALNQGDYVVYWDSYELSDHSHAYTGITLDEYQWYRIYKSGWVEQGGFNRTNGSNATRITIPVEMKTVNYTPVIQGKTEENGYTNAQWQVMPVNNTTSSTTTTSFVAQGSITGYNLGFRWQVSGFSFLA